MEEITNINSLGFIFALIAGVLLVTLPRRFALFPLLGVTCYMSQGQVVGIFGLHFTVLRILLALGWCRAFIRREVSSFRFCFIDKAFILWTVSYFILSNLLWRTSDNFIYSAGSVYNAVGIYFLFRFIIQDFEDIERLIMMLAILIVPLSIFFLIEKATGRNLFSFFGGVPDFTVIRDGKLRCQGAFRHPILAGTFAAALVPLFLSLWWINKARLLAALGVLAAVIICITSASSGPIMTMLFGVIALSFWPLRRYMRVVRWCILISIISLHMVMKAPVWFLMARIGESIGGTGWHRAELIDQAIKHFNEWWLLGTTYTAHWMPYVLPNEPNMVDITNTYIYQGVTGGLLTMILFVLLIVLSFKAIGQFMKENYGHSVSELIIVWSVGSVLFAHAISFLSVLYFDQSVIFWYLILAIIPTIAMSTPEEVTYITPVDIVEYE